MARKKGLGKGLGALIPEDDTLTNLIEEKKDSERVLNVDIEDIDASEGNPRKTFDEEALKDLAESIKLYGIIQPIVLTKNDKRYEIVAGERRYRAAKIAGLTTVPAIIKELDEMEYIGEMRIEDLESLRDSATKEQQ